MLSQSEISGLSEIALRYWITASDEGVGRVLRELNSGMTKAETQVDDSKAAALVKPRMLVATTTRSRLSFEGVVVFLTLLLEVSRQQSCQEAKS